MSPAQRNFRAFICYSRHDKAFASWLQKRIESYHVPPELVGKQGPFGKIGSSLRPVFRDLSDLETGSSLTGKLKDALTASEALIVVCSPYAVKSRYVSGEIRAYKSLHGDAGVLAIIVSGKPHDGGNNCFPEALCRVTSASGELTDDYLEPCAADAQESGDGRDLAFLKLVSGLLGVGLDVVVKREQEAKRAEKLRWMGVAGVMAVLAVASGVGFYLAWLRSIEAEASLRNAIDTSYKFAEKTVTLTSRVGMQSSTALELLTTTRTALDQISGKQGKSSAELELRQAQIGLAIAERYRTLTNYLGWERSASDAHGRLLALHLSNPGDRDIKRELGRAKYSIAEFARSQGKLAEALDKHKEVRDIRRSLFIQNETDPELLRELSATELAIAEISLQVGAYEGAISGFKDAYDYRRRLAALTPEDFRRELDSTVPLIGLGQVHRQRREFGKALEYFESANATRARISREHVDARLAMHLHSWSLASIAELLTAEGRGAEGIGYIQQGRSIRQKLLALDPSAVAQRDLAWASFILAQAYSSIDDLPQARTAIDETISIFNGHVTMNPDGPLENRNLAIANRLLARVLAKQDDPRSLETARLALSHHEKALARPDRRPDWEAEQAVTMKIYGQILSQRSDRSEALTQFEQALSVLGKALAAIPEHREWLDEQVEIRSLRDATTVASSADKR